uniref:MPN domain-containing protein n=1 Tax=Timspurckia oligopyrenoides TaxID=708627 RepID=A0A7S0ZD55_9RHOD|mmetsp:Transcript_13204/g.23727  ORF Transcript_13204/g.23727 Transcript_13204/m.23727 type:complete len:368 (+) Transcript_13204:56-1159(+)
MEEGRVQWEVANDVQDMDIDSGSTCDIYHYDSTQQRKLLDAKPWSRDMNYFQHVHISALALLKMTMHARSGGNIEIMGSLQGKLIHRGFIIMDVFPLPVEGTETRVNAHADGYEFMVSYQEQSSHAGRLENIVGWYHSHPGYGCWLSGIDVQTQRTNQLYQDPFVAIVIDPLRTVTKGKVDIGAFRTYPEGFNNNAQHSATEFGASSSQTSSQQANKSYQSIPVNKIEDFGVHCNQYYSLKVSCFKSNLDSTLLDVLWSKYWASIFSSSELISNREYRKDQINDLNMKLDRAQLQIKRGSRVGGDMMIGRPSSSSTPAGFMKPYVMPTDRSSQTESVLNTISNDSEKLAAEQLQALITLSAKHALFH